MTTRKIVLADYDPQWPQVYDDIAREITLIIGDNLVAVHHIGSTSITDMPAKPIIDVIVVVNDITLVDAHNDAFAQLGFTVKGENGMPFRRFFYRHGKPFECNIHTYQQGNAEIDRHLLFRDYMIAHPFEAQLYAQLKQTLAQQFSDDIYRYVIGKEQFVKRIDSISGYHGFRMVQALTQTEWQHYHNIRQTIIFAEHDIQYDRQHPDMSDPHHFHFVFFKDTDIIGALQIEFPDAPYAVLRTIAIIESQQNQGYGQILYDFAERWIWQQNKSTIKLHANPKALSFYKRLGFAPEDFPDPKSIDPNTIDMKKDLML